MKWTQTIKRAAPAVLAAGVFAASLTACGVFSHDHAEPDSLSNGFVQTVEAFRGFYLPLDEITVCYETGLKAVADYLEEPSGENREQGASVLKAMRSQISSADCPVYEIDQIVRDYLEEQGMNESDLQGVCSMFRSDQTEFAEVLDNYLYYLEEFIPLIEVVPLSLKLDVTYTGEIRRELDLGLFYAGNEFFIQADEEEKAYLEETVWRNARALVPEGAQWQNDVQYAQLKQQECFSRTAQLQSELAEKTGSLTVQEYAQDFNYVVSAEEQVHILTYLGTQSEVQVPGTIAGYPVTAVGKNAFAGKAIASVELAPGLQQIGDNAFSGCTSLQRIVLPESVSEFGSTPFEGCSQAVLYVAENSPAHQFAQREMLAFQIQ